MLIAKPVYLDGRRLDGLASTTIEAAELALASGAGFNIRCQVARTQHIGEGPEGFYVAREPGQYRGAR